MSASDPLVQFIRDRLNEDEQIARYAGPHRVGWATYLRPDGSMGYTSPVAESVPGHGDWWVADGKQTKPDSVRVVYDPARVLRGVEAKRWIVDEHAPVLSSVEWPHDQTGKGEAWICPRCANAENDQAGWCPAIGEAGTFPHEEFVVGYVLAPCRTLRLLASEWADHVEYRAEWIPCE